MLFANKKRKPKTVSAILQSANMQIRSYKDNYFWAERIYYILQYLWSTAYQRGYAKALKDMDAVEPDV
jgi:hypothetical protein